MDRICRKIKEIIYTRIRAEPGKVLFLYLKLNSGG